MLSFTAKTSPERSLPCVCGLARTAQCPCLSVSQLHQCIFHAFLHFFSISAGLCGPRSPGFDGRPAPLFAILCGEIAQAFHLVLFGPFQEIGRASCRAECVITFRSRWSPYHSKKIYK